MCPRSTRFARKLPPGSASATEQSGAHKTHNHPIGLAEPSQADEINTTRLRDAMALVDIRVLDHLIVAGDGVTSLADRGLL